MIAGSGSATSDKLDPDPHQFAYNKPKCMEYEPILALLQGFEPFLKDRIRIRIKATSRIRIRIQSDADPHH
jgi:hypothetical protein